MDNTSAEIKRLQKIEKRLRLGVGLSMLWTVAMLCLLGHDYLPYYSIWGVVFWIGFGAFSLTGISLFYVSKWKLPPLLEKERRWQK